CLDLGISSGDSTAACLSGMGCLVYSSPGQKNLPAGNDSLSARVFSGAAGNHLPTLGYRTLALRGPDFLCPDADAVAHSPTTQVCGAVLHGFGAAARSVLATASARGAGVHNSQDGLGSGGSSARRPGICRKSAALRASR